MRILIADFSGHPFTVQLSRSLAARGHEVLHLFTSSSETPKGDLVRRDDDAPGLAIRSVGLGVPVNKTNFVKRRSQERAIGRMFAREIQAFRPDIGICGNQPIETLSFAAPALRRCGAKFVFWVQDLLGQATYKVLSQRFGLPGRAIGSYYMGREGRLLRSADHVVAIAEDFRSPLDRIGVDPTKLSIIENWSPIDHIPLQPRDNDWANTHLPQSPLRVIYSGTLGFKQNPDALLDVAKSVACNIIVFSQGAAAASVETKARERGLDNFQVRDWVAFADMPKALGGADILAVLLEPDAGLYSVPSKVLTYLCVGRPIVAAIDSANLAARIINRTGAGIVCQPGDAKGLVAAVRAFASDPERARAAGEAGRRYAEETFNIARITDRFEEVIATVQAR